MPFGLRSQVFGLAALALAVCLCLCLCLPFTVRADALRPGSTVAIVPAIDLGADSVSSDVQRALAHAVKQAGHRGLTAGQVRAILAAEGQGHLCRSMDSCDYRLLLQALPVQALVVYSLWSDGGVPSELAVAIVEEARRGDASRKLSASDAPPRVVGELFKAAMSELEVATVVRVRIETEPSGAEVVVDRIYSGTAPSTFLLQPGQHQVRVSVYGRVNVLDFFEVPKGEQQHTVRLFLPEPSPDQALLPAPAPLPLPPPSARTSALDTVLGAVAGLTAVGLFGYGLVSIATCEGNCPSLGAISGAMLAGTSSALFLGLRPFAHVEEQRCAAGMGIVRGF